MSVHPSAILEGPSIEIDATAIVDALAYIRGPVVIGPRTHVYPHAVIGTDGEHRRLGPAGVVRIGADCIIREGVAVQRGTGERDTTIGDRCMLMHGVHVSHDNVIGDDVTLSPNVVLGGETRIHVGATMGIGAMTHQRSTVGAWAMVGMGAVVTRDVPPFCLVMGNPARWVRINAHPLAVLGIDPAIFRAGEYFQNLDRVSGGAVVRAANEAFGKDVRRPVMPHPH